MVRLTVDLISRGTSGYAKQKRDETVQQYLKRLTHLYLEDRNIDEVGEDLNICKSLTVLYLYDNHLHSIPNLNGNSNLTHLYLQNNNITALHGINGLQKLSKLYIGGNNIAVVESLDKLPMLQELHLENQKLPDGEKLLFDPRTLLSISNSLQVLNVSGNCLDSIVQLRCLQLITQFMASDNHLSDMKELANVLRAWPHLWRLDLFGNPLSHKAKYRDRVIIMSPALEVMDGKEVTDTAKKFLQNWQANKERQKNETRHGTAHTHMLSAGDNNASRTVATSAASRLGNDVPGYIMPALPRKQFQDILARSVSQPNTGLSNSHSYLDMPPAPRYSVSMNYAYFYAHRPRY